MTIHTISPKDLLTYLCLRRYKSNTTGEASVPITKLVTQSGAAPVTILTSLKRLESLGYISYTKRGRANFYSFPIEITASSYDFLDSDMPYQDKIQEAARLAVFKKPKTGGTDRENSKLKRYIVDLESKIVGMSNHIRVLTDELNAVKRKTSLLTGQPYEPIPVLDS